jgi:broad specificity phosphatase PhoE
MITPLIVHLVRHAETSSYDYDAGLTHRGRVQARERAEAFADTLHDGRRIDIVYAPTE